MPVCPWIPVSINISIGVWVYLKNTVLTIGMFTAMYYKSITQVSPKHCPSIAQASAKQFLIDSQLIHYWFSICSLLILYYFSIESSLNLYWSSIDSVWFSINSLFLSHSHRSKSRFLLPFLPLSIQWIRGAPAELAGTPKKMISTCLVPSRDLTKFQQSARVK